MTGSFMASIAIKATLILVLGLGAHRVLRRSRAAVRHLLLLAVCAAVLALPAAALVLPVFAIPLPYPVPVSLPSVLLEAPAGVAFTPLARDVVPQFAAGSSEFVSITRLVLIVEMIGATVALLPLIAGLWQTRRLRAAARQWPDGQQRIERLVVDAGIRRRVDVLVHDGVPGPVTCGMRRPVLLFPADAKDWDDRDFDRAAIHELEHVRRHDWATDCFARVVCALYWFHPLVWVTWRQLRLESERAADDAVVRAREGTAYADLLVTLAERLVAGQRHYGMAMASRRDLPLRIQALLDVSLPRARAGRRAIVITVLLTAAAIAGVAPLGPLTETSTAAAVQPDARASSITPNQEIPPQREVIPASRVRPASRVTVPPAVPPAEPPAAEQAELPSTPAPPPLTPAPSAPDRRLMVLFFDITIEPDALRRATAAGVRFVNETVTDADSVAVVTGGTSVRVVQDFTSNREELRTALESPGLLNETAPDAGADRRLRALTTLCAMLRPFEPRKTVFYFRSGMNVTAGAALAELRAATNACMRANVAMFPIDARGLRFAVGSVF